MPCSSCPVLMVQRASYCLKIKGRHLGRPQHLVAPVLGCITRDPVQARDFFLQSRRRLSSSTVRYESSSSNKVPDEAFAQEYCSSLLRKYDSPSYTLQRFIPPHMLKAYLAIRAFNVEIARVADLVSNPTIGSMRMQFWRNTIKSTFDHRPPAEPVAILLASVLERCKLNQSWFLRVISARESNAINPQYATIDDLEHYAESTYSTLLYLTLSAYPLNSVTFDHLASHIGKAAGICAILRGLPILAFPSQPTHHPSPTAGLGQPATGSRRGVITLPLEIMSRTGVREENVYRQGGPATGLKDAVFEVATRASDHLITARSMLASVQRNEDVDHAYEHENDDGHHYEGKPDSFLGEAKQSSGSGPIPAFGVLMGPAVATQLWLDRLQKCDFDIFHPSLRGPEWRLPFVAWWRHRQNQL